jgi:hypothetical protein
MVESLFNRLLISFEGDEKNDTYTGSASFKLFKDPALGYAYLALRAAPG